MELTADCDGDCGRRVTRGASWLSSGNFLVANWGFYVSTGRKADFIGFRVARPLD